MKARELITTDQIVFRSHSFGELCTGTRSSKDELGDTAKIQIRKVFMELVRGTYSKKIDTMYMTKGTELEMHSIQRTARVNGWGICLKNTTLLKDHIGEGTPDVRKPEIPGFDAKCCFTDEQFLKVFMSTELTDKNNIYQAKRYAMMDGVDRWYVCKTLENSPESVVVSHAWKLWKEAEGDGPVTDEFIDDVRALHRFEHLPDWARVKTFDVPLTSDDIVYINRRHELSVNYFYELYESYLSANPNNKQP